VTAFFFFFFLVVVVLSLSFNQTNDVLSICKVYFLLNPEEKQDSLIK